MTLDSGSSVSDASRPTTAMQMPASVLTVRLAVRDDARRELAALLGQVRTIPGCLRAALAEEADAAGRLVLIEEWATREDLERHLRSDGFWRVLLLSESSSEPPEFSIDTVAAREGLDAIARARSVRPYRAHDHATCQERR